MSDSPVIQTTNLNQEEHRQISTALEVERLEDNLFRSRVLWVPPRARGVFGGCGSCPAANEVYLMSEPLGKSSAKLWFRQQTVSLLNLVYTYVFLNERATAHLLCFP
jgi:hypothetical protein